MKTKNKKTEEVVKTLTDVLESVDEVQFKVLRPELTPVKKGNSYGVKANGGFTLPPRNVFEVDCGLALKLPSDYAVHIETSPDWSKRGLIVQSVSYTNQDWFYVKLIVTNIGKQIMSFQDAVIANMTFHVVPKFNMVSA
jgi:hypothetical protein